MPIYEYRCNNGHTFEVIRKIHDAPVSVCEECGDPVERVFHPIAIHFKGSGFHNTDYGRSKGKGGGNGSQEKKQGGDKGDTGAKKSESSDKKKSDTSTSASGDKKSD